MQLYKTTPSETLERLLQYTLDHFHIDIPNGTIRITYQKKESEVFSESIEKFYAEAFEEYQQDTYRYQLAAQQYEELGQAYVLHNGANAEELELQRIAFEAIKKPSYEEWYADFIRKVIMDDWNNFEQAIQLLDS